MQAVPYCSASGPEHKRRGSSQGERVIELPDSMSLVPLWEKDVVGVVLCQASVIHWSLDQYFHSLFSYKLDYNSAFESYTQFYCPSSVSFSLFLQCRPLFAIVSLNWKYAFQSHQTVNTGLYFQRVFLLRNTALSNSVWSQSINVMGEKSVYLSIHFMILCFEKQ